MTHGKRHRIFVFWFGKLSFGHGGAVTLLYIFYTYVISIGDNPEEHALTKVNVMYETKLGTDKTILLNEKNRTATLRVVSPVSEHPLVTFRFRNICS